MATTKNGGGFVPSRIRGGSPNSGATNQFRIANAFSGNIYLGDSVTYDTAGKTLTATSGTGATDTNFAEGVFKGCFYVDPTWRTPRWSKNFVAGTSSLVGTPIALVANDQNATFVIQADATISVGDVGLNFEVTLGAGNTFTGGSGFMLKAASRTNGAALLRMVGLYETPDNGYETGASGGDPFPYVEVQWLQNNNARVSAV